MLISECLVISEWHYLKRIRKECDLAGGVGHEVSKVHGSPVSCSRRSQFLLQHPESTLPDGFGGVCIGPVTSSWGTEGTGVQGHGDSLGIW